MPDPVFVAVTPYVMVAPGTFVGESTVWVNEICGSRYTVRVWLVTPLTSPPATPLIWADPFVYVPTSVLETWMLIVQEAVPDESEPPDSATDESPAAIGVAVPPRNTEPPHVFERVSGL